MRHRILLVLLLSLFSTAMRPQSDSIRVSLVTCTPGTIVYEVYGHTAIRVTDYTTGVDLAFNYGMFDFNSPHFLYRWLKGETDYFVAAYKWDSFVQEYASRGSTLYLQELNLDNEGHQRLAELLVENCMPENRTYRYDFLNNNCATMALDKIEEAFGGSIRYYPPDGSETFRTLLHRYNGLEPWNEFGVDLIVGAGTDVPITYRQATFAPMRLKEFADNAYYIDTTGTTHGIVFRTTEIRPEKELTFPDCLITPFQAAILLALLTLLICCIEWRIKKFLWAYDIILFGIQGLAGIIVSFLYFCSEHPTTDTNWLVICLNPLPLICLPFLVRNLRKHRADVFLPLNFVILTVFLLTCGMMPQYFHPATLIMLGTFALRSLSDMHQNFVFGAVWEKFISLFRRNGSAAALLAVLLTVFPLQARSQQTEMVQSNIQPRLIVGITVDQLDMEYVERLMPLFGEDGFRKLWQEGCIFTNAEFDYDCRDCSSAIASLYTGTSPFYHGIVADRWMDRKAGMVIGAVDDSNESGINTIDHSSPGRLQVMTLTDCMKISSDGRSVICSVAANREAAVLSAGHEADVALWMNDSDGQWSSSGYFGSFPSWANDINNRSWFRKEWSPMYPSAVYIHDGAAASDRTFSHTFSRGDVWKYKQSPIGNDNVTEMALASFDALKLGRLTSPDLLAVTLYAGAYDGGPVSMESLELQDIYVRLDRNIADIITEVTEAVGEDKVLFFITSTGHRTRQERDLTGTRIPAGSVSMERVTALLNLYLSALHEKGGFVSAYHGTELYLNRTLIEDSAIPLQRITDECRSFLLQMSGIQSVMSQNDLFSGNLSDETIRRRNAINFSCSGDIIIEVCPGWTVMDEDCNMKFVSHLNRTTFPIIFYGGGVTKGIREQRIQASALTSTLAWILSIPAPESCTATPLKDIMKH